MNTFYVWLRTPHAESNLVGLLSIYTGLIISVWFLLPIVLGTPVEWTYLALPLSAQNVAVTMSRAFGEEAVFRAIPIALLFAAYPNSNTRMFITMLVTSFVFGMWHEWIFTAKTCLGFGGAILSVAYLKFGGAHGDPFKGFLACGSIHFGANLVIAIIANMNVGVF